MRMVRRFFAFAGERVFASPYLPDALVRAGLLVVLADLCVFLLEQPAAYWIDRSRAESLLPPLQAVLAVHPLAFAGLGLVYLGVVWAVTGLLTRRLALIAWTAIAAVHLYHMLAWAIHATVLALDLNMAGGLLDLGAWASAALMLGLLLSVFLLRTAQVTVAEADRASSWRYAWIAAAVIVVGLAAGAVFLTVGSARNGWQPVHPAHSPGPRGIASLAYDTKRNMAVLFGGTTAWIGSGWTLEDDTWEWDGRDWAQRTPVDSPDARRGQAMAYDEKRGVVVMFGGEGKYGLLEDTWEWDGKDWRFAGYSPGGMPVPPARTDHQLFYDPQRGTVVLYGGFHYVGSDKKVVFYSDAWEWNGDRWSPIPQDAAGPYASAYALAYDSSGGRFVAITNGALLEWRDAHWSNVSAPDGLVSRVAARMAADPAGLVVLFGGVRDNINLDETWVRSGSDWKQLHLGLTPSGRNAQAIFFDRVRNTFVLYGGVNKDGVLADMWELAPVKAEGP